MVPQPASHRRVSYVIPLPADSPPRLLLPPLGAPRNGSVRPLLVSAPVPTLRRKSEPLQSCYSSTNSHLRHCLGVSSLALDISTQLKGKVAPEGILYSGGRDGRIIAWNLKLPMQKRAHRYGSTSRGSGWRKGRWEVLTGWADNLYEEYDSEEEIVGSDGDILGEVVDTVGRNRRISRSLVDAVPYEESWELNTDESPTPSAEFRQSIQTHTDWVNDVLLCNMNQTVVSASSDGSVRAWSPHLSTITEPALVGMHDDYVRCLASSPHQNWIASGSFDRTIKLWDISRTITSSTSTGLSSMSNTSAMSTLSLPAASQKSSVYAITTDQFGSMIASGSPERVVRIWDPRAGKRTAKLVGHTDIIRAVVLSADGRYLLTGSADASVKLWSLATQRCLHTFAHHTDSVWALSSQHPSLEIFYSGDRSGIISRVDVEGCNTVDEGECLVLCNGGAPEVGQQPPDRRRFCDGFALRDSAGINKIVTLDDRLLWTATGSSSINRWKTPTRRALRIGGSGMLASPDSAVNSSNLMPSTKRESGSSDIHSPRRGFSLSFDGRRFSDEAPRAGSPGTPRGKNFSISTSILHPMEEDVTLYGIPYQSLVRLVSPNETYVFGSSPPGRVRRHTSRDAEIATLYSAASVKSVPGQASRNSVTPMTPASAVRNTFRSNTGGSLFVAPPPDTEDDNWATSPRSQYEGRELAAAAVPLETGPDDVIKGGNGLVRAIVLNDRMHALTVNTTGHVGVWDIARCRCVGWFDRGDVFAEMGNSDEASVMGNDFHSPRDLLETVRERIEGESVIPVWATVDTRIGNLTVHLSEKCFETEIYADEAGYGSERLYDTDQRLNVAKWVLSNLFEGFVREELKLRRPSSHSGSHGGRTSGSQEARSAVASLSGNLKIGRKRSSTTLSKVSTSSGASRPLVSSVVISPSILPVIAPDVKHVAVRPRAPAYLTTPLIPIAAAQESLSPGTQPSTVGGTASSAGTPTPLSASESSNAGRNISAKDADYFSTVRGRHYSANSSDDFSGWTGPGSSSSSKDRDAVAPVPTPTPSTPSSGGFMGRLRQLGKSSKRPLSGDVPSISGGSTVSQTSEGHEEDHKEDLSGDSEPETEQSRFLGTLFSQVFHPPSSTDAPPLFLPQNTEILVADESQPGWTNVYRGTVATTAVDTTLLEKVMPLWLMQYLLSNKTPLVPNVKVSFGVVPWPGQGEGPAESASTRLTANRYLRIRKILGYVQEKIDTPTSRSTSRSGSISGATPRSSSEALYVVRSANATSSYGSITSMDGGGGKKPRPEDVYDLFCNDLLLPLDMTLASVRQYIWRSSAELVLVYRRKA